MREGENETFEKLMRATKKQKNDLFLKVNEGDEK